MFVVSYKLVIINFDEGLFPRVSEAHCGYTSLQEYFITILRPYGLWLNGLPKIILFFNSIFFRWGSPPSASQVASTPRRKRHRQNGGRALAGDILSLILGINDVTQWHYQMTFYHLILGTSRNH